MKHQRPLTSYQIEIMQHLKRASAEEPLDFDQLLESLSWTPSKESAQFSFRALCAKGMIAKAEMRLRRGRKRICYVLTLLGVQALDPRLASVKKTDPVPEAGELKKEIDFVPGVEDVVVSLPQLDQFFVED